MGLREYYYQFGQPAAISTATGQVPVVEFWSLNCGLKLEDVPTEFEGNKIQVMMYQGDCW